MHTDHCSFPVLSYYLQMQAGKFIIIRQRAESKSYGKEKALSSGYLILIVLLSINRWHNEKTNELSQTNPAIKMLEDRLAAARIGRNKI